MVAQIDLLAQFLRSVVAIAYVQPTSRGLVRTGIRRFVIGASGMDNRGCCAAMEFYDVYTRIWRGREK
jgi:hypothetical protein